MGAWAAMEGRLQREGPEQGRQVGLLRGEVGRQARRGGRSRRQVRFKSPMQRDRRAHSHPCGHTGDWEDGISDIEIEQRVRVAFDFRCPC